MCVPKAMFAFHTEDVDLYSINYIHFGQPKRWYGVPTASRNRFEIMAQGSFPSDYAACREFLRHKTTMVNILYNVQCSEIFTLRNEKLHTET